MINRKQLLALVAALNAIYFFILPFTAMAAAVTAEEQASFDKGNYILLQVPIPSPTCAGVTNGASFTGNEQALCCQHQVLLDIVADKNAALDQAKLSDKIKVICPYGSIAAVKNAPAFVTSFFQFIIIFLAIALTGILVVAGILYVTSGGNPARAGKAMDYMRNAAYSLVVLIFSAVILNQIGPRFTQLGITDVTSIVAKFQCTELKDQATCQKGNNCSWDDSAKVCRNASSVSCNDLSPSDCDKQSGRCKFDTAVNVCIAVRSSGAPSCTVTLEKNACFSQTGCVWDRSCLPKNPSDQNAVTACVALTEGACEANALCVWPIAAPYGCVLETTAREKNCSSFGQTDCPQVGCWLSTSGCVAITPPGQACTADAQCGYYSFCDPNAKKCRSKLAGDQSCSAFGNVGCLSGNCVGFFGSLTGTTQSGTCSTPGQ